MGAMASAKAQANAATAQANAAAYNAQVDKANGQQAVQVANTNALTKSRAAAYEMSEQRASIGQSGTAFTGTNLDVIGQSAQNAALDAATIRYGGDQQQWADNNQVTLDTMQETQDNQNASNATTAGYFGAASSVLGAANGYMSYKAHA